MIFPLRRRDGASSTPLSLQPYSPQTLEKGPRIAGATLTHSVCPYCAVGCSLNVYTKGGRIIDIEGNPESPINEGKLCPKGANSFQLAVNSHRIKQVLYRAPYSDRWETKSSGLGAGSDRAAREGGARRGFQREV